MMGIIRMSDRLYKQIHQVHGRNLQATMKHYEADADRDFGGLRPVDEYVTAYDWRTRRFIEGGICWRDTGSNRFSRGGGGR